MEIGRFREIYAAICPARLLKQRQRDFHGLQYRISNLSINFTISPKQRICRRYYGCTCVKCDIYKCAALAYATRVPSRHVLSRWELKLV